MNAPQLRFAFPRELIVDLFAGGGGASLGIEQAFGRPVDIAVNHDADAVAMHAANHPDTEHLRADVFEVNPLTATQGRQVGLLWASPDCKHFSKAKGGKPRSKKIRSLAWVVVKWADIVRPRVIMLENVEEFITWGPLASNGQPCPQRKGATFKRWVGRLRGMGYKVEWKELRACDYGAPTIRKRFYLIARCDGLPIRWPAPTHAKPGTGSKLPAWRTAAECIDFTLPTPSIFLTKDEGRAVGVKRPLAEATMRRIAKGVDRFVLQAAKPFIVPVVHPRDSRVHAVDEPMRTVTGSSRGAHALAVPVIEPVPSFEEWIARTGKLGGTRHEYNSLYHPGCPDPDAVIAPLITEHANASRGASWSPTEPLHTQCAEVKGGHFALASAFLTKYRGENAGSASDEPFPTVTANGESARPGGNPPLAVVGCHLLKQFGGNESPGWPLEKPISTVTAQDHHHLVASSMVKLRGDNVGAPVDTPLHTVSAQGWHHAEVRAFLIKFYREGGQWQAVDDPMHTVPTRDRMGLVTVEGEEYAIADIGLRMLTPRELFRAQGFPEDYKIGLRPDGSKLSKTLQVRMCGNSVCPPVAKALVAANVAEVQRAEAQVA